MIIDGINIETSKYFPLAQGVNTLFNNTHKLRQDQVLRITQLEKDISRAIFEDQIGILRSPEHVFDILEEQINTLSEQYHIPNTKDSYSIAFSTFNSRTIELSILEGNLNETDNLIEYNYGVSFYNKIHQEYMKNYLRYRDQFFIKRIFADYCNRLALLIPPFSSKQMPFTNEYLSLEEEKTEEELGYLIENRINDKVGNVFTLVGMEDGIDKRVQPYLNEVYGVIEQLDDMQGKPEIRLLLSVEEKLTSILNGIVDYKLEQNRIATNFEITGEDLWDVIMTIGDEHESFSDFCNYALKVYANEEEKLIAYKQLKLAVIPELLRLEYLD